MRRSRSSRPGFPRRRIRTWRSSFATAARGPARATRGSRCPCRVKMKTQVGGLSGSMGAGAFQSLARHVRDVRVAEHQQIGGKIVTTIAGEIDTAGLLVRSRSSARSPGRRACASLRPRRARPEDRRHQGGALDRRAHAAPRRRPRHAQHRGAGEDARVRASLPPDERERAGRAARRLRASVLVRVGRPGSSSLRGRTKRNAMIAAEEREPERGRDQTQHQPELGDVEDGLAAEPRRPSAARDRRCRGCPLAARSRCGRRRRRCGG